MKKKNDSLYYVTLTENSLTIHYYTKVKKTVEKALEETSVEYALTEVSTAELLQHRASNMPGFVLKKDGRYFYTSIPKNLKLISQEWVHLCGECSNLFPSRCKKVQDLSKKYCFSSQEEEEKCSLRTLQISKRIEKYNFITFGFETFNVNQECLTVLECSNFSKSSADINKKKLSPAESQSLKLALAQVIWPDISSRAQSRDRYEKNRYSL